LVVSLNDNFLIKNSVILKLMQSWTVFYTLCANIYVDSLKYTQCGDEVHTSWSEVQTAWTLLAYTEVHSDKLYTWCWNLRGVLIEFIQNHTEIDTGWFWSLKFTRLALMFIQCDIKYYTGWY
jgi:hypothetical protein